MAIGHTPNTAVFEGQLEMDEQGYLLVHDGTTATSVPGRLRRRRRGRPPLPPGHHRRRHRLHGRDRRRALPEPLRRPCSSATSRRPTRRSGWRRAPRSARCSRRHSCLTSSGRCSCWPASSSATIAPGDTAFTPLRFDSYPVSHSLLTVAAWGAAFGAVHFWRKRRPRGRARARRLAVGHWVLDFVSHRPDMPLWPGGPRLGLGLWNSVPATVVVELLMFAAGLGSRSRPRARATAIGRWGFVGLAALLLLIYAANVTSPPPPSMEAVGWAGVLGGLLLLGLAAWIDRHR